MGNQFCAKKKPARPLSPKIPPPLEPRQESPVNEFDPPKDSSEIESFLLGVKLNSILMKGGVLKDILKKIYFPSKEIQLNLIKKAYQKLRTEEHYLDSYRKHQGFIGDVMKKIVYLLNIDMERLNDLPADSIFNPDLPSICLEGILMIYHIVISHKMKSNDTVEIWWTTKKYEKKLDSVITILIIISGKIKYEFDKKTVIEKQHQSNLHENSFLARSSKSLTKDIAFESEFLKNKEKIVLRENSGISSPTHLSPKPIEKYASSLAGFWETQEADNLVEENKGNNLSSNSLELVIKSSEVNELEPTALTMENYTGEITVGKAR